MPCSMPCGPCRIRPRHQAGTTRRCRASSRTPAGARLPCCSAFATTQARLVFTVRRDHLLLHAGQVAFPGGGSEPADGGSALLTALRESEEEIGLAPALVTPLGYLDCLETTSGFCVTPVVAHIAPHAQLVPSPDEVAEVFEVPLAYFLDPRHRHC